MKTAAQVCEMLRASAPGITFRREESGEYRVTFTQAAIAAAFPGLSRAELIAKAESLAAYESDADSVLETGLAMARTGLRDFGAELAARRELEAAALDPAAVPAEPEAAPVRETIRLEMNWSGAAGIIAAALENGTGAGKRAAREELARMAELADERNRLARELAERESAELAAIGEALEREESAAPVNLDNARAMGALACDCDLPRSANPFPAGDAADAWDSGYSEAVAQWRAAKRAEIADSFGDAAAGEF